MTDQERMIVRAAARMVAKDAMPDEALARLRTQDAARSHVAGFEEFRMVANRTLVHSMSRFWWVAVPGAAAPVLLVIGACWWLTPPLDSADYGRATDSQTRSGDDSSASLSPIDQANDDLPEWPEEQLGGREAKEYLLGFMQRAVDFLDQVPGYTAEMRRQERLEGKLGPEQVLRLKVQHEPFAVYLRFEAPRAGKEALYHEERFDGQVLAHNGDWTRRFIPRLKVDPNGPVALADNRHPITDAGLANLSRKLLHYRELDLDDPLAETILDRTTDEDGKVWYRATHSHLAYTDDRPFAYVEVLYCPDLLIPLHIVSYDWPDETGGCCGEGDQYRLAERYHYENVDFDVSFSSIDFDPTNPDYGFQRY